MEMSPQRVRSAEFKTVRKGADLDEVRRFLNDVADELERAQNQSTAMEARARAAVARLQEVSDGQVAPTEAPARVDEPVTRARRPVRDDQPHAGPGPAHRRRTDRRSTRRRRQAGVDRERRGGGDPDSTREMAAAMLDEAREEARRASESERLLAASEVDALKARRDFLESDVDHLEQFLIAQRGRVRDAATELLEITDRVPAGLGEVRRPLLSASDDASPDDAASAAPGFAGAPTGAASPEPARHRHGGATTTSPTTSTRPKRSNSSSSATSTRNLPTWTDDDRRYDPRRSRLRPSRRAVPVGVVGIGRLPIHVRRRRSHHLTTSQPGDSTGTGAPANLHRRPRSSSVASWRAVSSRRPEAELSCPRRGRAGHLGEGVDVRALDRAA